MQRFEVWPTEVALHFYECTRPDCWLLRPEVIVGHGAKGELVSIPARRPVGLWIGSCGDCAESLFCCRSRLLGAQYLGRSEQQAAGAAGPCVLNAPGLADLITAAAKSESEAGQCAVKMDYVGLAGWQNEPGNSFAVEFHRCPWEAYGKR